MTPAEVLVWEDLDVEIMCGLIETDESARIDAMSRLVVAYKEHLYRFVRRQFWTFSAEDAADVVQQTFIEVWRKVQNAALDTDGSLKCLLFTMCRRTAIDEWRKRTARIRTDDEFAQVVSDSIAGTDVAYAWRLATIQGEQAREIRDLFRQFVSNLPEQQCLVAEALYAQMPDWANNMTIIKYIRDHSGAVVTAVAVKGAKQALTAKFRDLLKERGFLV